MKSSDTPDLLPSRAVMERALAHKDTSFDGIFYSAVRTTGIFCRPSCPSRPEPRNVEFFASVRECLFAGYRPCKRCQPEQANGAPPAWVAALQERVTAAPDVRLKADDLRALGITPEKARRWFLQHHGMTFVAWCRGHRLSGAFARIRQGAKLDDTALDSGFESHSGFRAAFQRTFGSAPGRARSEGDQVVVTLLESPVGPLLAGTVQGGLCLLEFTDRRIIERNIAEVRRHFNSPAVPGRHPILQQLESELQEYFNGRRRDFTVALAPRGTLFQERVWEALRAIPYGTSISYDDLARHIDQPTAQRAVARANGMNRITILIPCHRVIGKNGALTGYGGGLWRKRLLLELERTGCLPGNAHVQGH